MEQLFGLDVPIQLWIGVAIAFAVGVVALILERRLKEGSLPRNCCETLASRSSLPALSRSAMNTALAISPNGRHCSTR